MSLVALLQVTEGCSQTLAATRALMVLGFAPSVALLLSHLQCIRTKASNAHNIIQTSKNNCGMWVQGLRPGDRQASQHSEISSHRPRHIILDTYWQ